jgi:hypothetical protein
MPTDALRFSFWGENGADADDALQEGELGRCDEEACDIASCSRTFVDPK